MDKGKADEKRIAELMEKGADFHEAQSISHVEKCCKNILEAVAEYEAAEDDEARAHAVYELRGELQFLRKFGGDRAFVGSVDFVEENQRRRR
jgi:hypothetical protein